MLRHTGRPRAVRTHPTTHQHGCGSARATLTSTGISELRSSKETEVARPRPNGLGVSKTQPGAEVVGVQRLLPVDRVVAGGIVGAAHPDLRGPEDRMLAHHQR